MGAVATRIRDLSVVVVLVGISVMPCQAAGTFEQRHACREDALKFCGQYVPDVARITACMEQHIRQLSPLCRAQFKTRR